MLYLINKLLSVVSSDILFFFKKKTHLFLVYNAEIMVIDLDLYDEHRLEDRITGSKTDLDLYASIYGTSWGVLANAVRVDCIYIH